QAWGGPALAQSAAGPSAPRPSIEAQAPAFTVGESWEFSFETALEPQKNEHYSQTVVAINDGRAAIAVNGGQSASLQLDASGNVVKTASGSFEPSDSKLQFPLSVGKRWSISYVYRTGTWASQVDRTANVVGVERIHTAGGDFDTFRIEQATSWSGSSGNGGHGGSRETDWYAPTTGRIVRMDYEDQSPRRAPTKTHAELTSFHSVPP
ncbi:hypothetical protein, partial [Caballeronia sp. M23-90]